jgi:cell wall-associated NlpC family hydrolase
MNRRERWMVALLVVAQLGLILACGSGGVVATRGPRWACPSPTPLPYGEAGPIKEIITHTRPITEGGDWEEIIYYAEWEQEYPDAGGPPFPSPTPYALVGTSYIFGQRVEVWPVHVQVDASAGPPVTSPGVAAGSQQLYFIDITWDNHALEPFVMPYGERVRLRAVTSPSGAVLSDARWGMTSLALHLANLEPPPDLVPPGVSQVRISVLAPPGEPETVDLLFAANPDYLPLLPTSTTLPGTPTPTAVVAPPAPNDELRASEAPLLTVQWSNATWVPPQAEPCADPGALTDWSGEEVAWGVPAALQVAAPPGADRLIQIVLNQVGKPYIWGAKGPEAFDCSGLATWSYAQIGIAIPQGTAGQWPHMRPVEQHALQLGDLIFFDIEGRGRIDHVGVLAGDLDGDGRWDMVHAASPRLGVRADYAVFESAYYGPRIRGFRTAR